MNWVITNWEDIAELTRQHLQLALPPILISLLIAIPIGRYAFSHPLFGRPLLNAASLMYAVPSLPLIITIPIIIGTPLRSHLTMITALTVYGVALLVRTAADAFASVDAHTRDAALALGHSPPHNPVESGPTAGNPRHRVGTPRSRILHDWPGHHWRARRYP